MLADMAIKIRHPDAWVNNTMKMMDTGIMVQKRGLHLQDLLFRLCQEVTSNAVQIFGGYGWQGYPVEKLIRDVKVFPDL